LSAINGLPPYTWSSNIPPGDDGFVFDPATGTISNPSGPTVTGSGQVDFEVTDAVPGDFTSAILSLTVDP
jgi:hypothetical protein